MTINEAYKQLKHLEKMGTNIVEAGEIFRTNYDLQFAFDYIEDTGDMKSEMKAQQRCFDYNTKRTGFSLRSMSAYRSGHLKLVFNPFDLKEYKEFFWMIHPWKDEYNCIRNAAVGIQKLARRFELQDDILSLREFETPFSLSRDCFMEIMGVMNDVCEADDFIVGLANYSKINHLTNCYLKNGSNNLKEHYELIAGSAAMLFSSMGAEFLTSTYGTIEQRNHVLSTFRILAHSSSNLSLTKDELDDINKLAKKRPSDKEMAKRLAESAKFHLEKEYTNGFRDMRVIKQPREAELTMRLAQSMAPELLESLIEKIAVLMNNLSFLKDLANKVIHPCDAYTELIECYERSESYTEDFKDFIQKPAALYYHKEIKELKKEELDNFFVNKFSKHVVCENELYRQCGELFFIADGKWGQLMEILEQLPKQEDNFRICLTYLSYQQQWIKRHFLEPLMVPKDVVYQQQNEKTGDRPIKKFQEFINPKEAWRTEIIIQKLHRLIGNKTKGDAIMIITKAWWIGWLSAKPTANSIRREFPSTDCSDTIFSRVLNESKPTIGGNVNEEAIEQIRKEFEAA